MGRAQSKEKEAHGIALHLPQTQTAQGRGLCPARRTPFHALPLFFGGSATMQVSASALTGRVRPVCREDVGRLREGKSDQMEDDCPQ